MLGRVLLVGLLFLTCGCSQLASWLKGTPTPILPPEELYQIGENEMGKRRYTEARAAFLKIVERHPNSSYAPRARFLMGESYYREAEFDKAVKEFETFMAFYPRHQIADLVQYRLAMSYYDRIKPIEQDQGLAQKALEHFKKLVKEYPDSRYANDSLAKIDICRGRLAQKEVWIANYYLVNGNPSAARQRLEAVLRDYPHALVVPEALYMLADVKGREGKPSEANDLLQRLSSEFPYTEWGRRAAQRLQAQR